MTKPQDDPAFKALKAVAAEMEPPVNQALLLDLYMIQRDSQYNDDDRSAVIDQMSKRIVAEIDGVEKGQ